MVQGGQIPAGHFRKLFTSSSGGGGVPGGWKGDSRGQQALWGAQKRAAAHSDNYGRASHGTRTPGLGRRDTARAPSLLRQDHTAHLRLMASAGKSLIYFQLCFLAAGGPHAPGPHGSQTNRRRDLTWVQNALEGPAGSLCALSLRKKGPSSQGDAHPPPTHTHA